MPWEIWKDVTPEEEEELLKQAEEYIAKYGMEPIALLLLETMKPLVYVGGEMGRFFIAPLLPFLDHKADAFIHTFEQRKNIDKLITSIEKKLKEEGKKKREERKKPKERDQEGTPKKKKWWFF